MYIIFFKNKITFMEALNNRCFGGKTFLKTLSGPGKTLPKQL